MLETRTRGNYAEFPVWSTLRNKVLPMQQAHPSQQKTRPKEMCHPFLFRTAGYFEARSRLMRNRTCIVPIYLVWSRPKYRPWPAINVKVVKEWFVILPLPVAPLTQATKVTILNKFDHLPAKCPFTERTECRLSAAICRILNLLLTFTLFYIISFSPDITTPSCTLRRSFFAWQSSL